ncbi:MAG TPA: hypothetical protein VF611_14960 [Pyrinomonadaceae bacterium]|jgi:hypothetical protein
MKTETLDVGGTTLDPKDLPGRDGESTPAEGRVDAAGGLGA